MNRLRQTLPQFFSPLKARYHYLSMAQRNFKEHLQGDSIRLKKYFYVLRPLLAVKWIDEGKAFPPCRSASCWQDRPCLLRHTAS